MLLRPPACCCLDSNKKRPEEIIYLDTASMRWNFLPTSNAADADEAMCVQSCLYPWRRYTTYEWPSSLCVGPYGILSDNLAVAYIKEHQW